MQVVYKFLTGQAVPKGGKYLCTTKVQEVNTGGLSTSVEYHYFLFDLPIEQVEE